MAKVVGTELTYLSGIIHFWHLLKKILILQHLLGNYSFPPPHPTLDAKTIRKHDATQGRAGNASCEKSWRRKKKLEEEEEEKK